MKEHGKNKEARQLKKISKISYIPFYGALTQDGVFEDNIYGWENALKKKLKKKNIEIHTNDILPIKEADGCLIFDNIFYSNLDYIWEMYKQKKLHKSVYIDYEPPTGHCKNHSNEGIIRLSKIFKHVITYNDDVIDNKRIVKGNIGNFYSKEIKEPIDFNKKKLVTMITSYINNEQIINILNHFNNTDYYNQENTPIHKNEIYSQREIAAKYLMKKCPKDFDLYGYNWNSEFDLVYKGPLDKQKKLSVLSKYKFIISYDSYKEQNGYISEKIFDAFQAKVIPVYWGAKNITDYIPKECFVDKRDFNSYDELYSYLTNMSEEEYNNKINSIDEFLKSDIYNNLFSSKASAKIIEKCLTDEISNFSYDEALTNLMWFETQKQRTKNHKKENKDNNGLITKNKNTNKLIKNIQFAENDLVGNKFNGFDLHRQLRERNIDSKQVVLNKESDDNNTYVFDYLMKDSTKELIKQRMIFESDILHFHHIHNILDLNYLPILSNLLPCVITLHEPFFLGGHCVHSFDCEKWKNHCFDCEYLSIPYAIQNDFSSLNFELKKQAIQNSQISVIVASDWMVNRVKASPIWKDKKIYKIPFGVDETIFKPSKENANETRKKMGISIDAVVIMFRSSNYKYKGTDIVKKALNNIKTKKEIVIITVDVEGLFEEYKEKFRIIEFGWIKDDNLLAALYQIIDIFLMPSMYETFGMMALEAMSCGKMVLAIESENSAIDEVINSPKCGILSSKKDFNANLNRLINNLDETTERGVLSLKHIRKNNSLELYLDNIEKAYQEIISNHKKTNSSILILEQLYKHMPKDSQLLKLTKKDENESIVSQVDISNINNTDKKTINFREIFRKIVPYKIRKFLKNIMYNKN